MNYNYGSPAFVACADFKSDDYFMRLLNNIERSSKWDLLQALIVVRFIPDCVVEDDMLVYRNPNVA